MQPFFEFVGLMIKNYQPFFAALIASGIAYLGYLITKKSVERSSLANLERMQKEHKTAISLLTMQIDNAHEISKNNFGMSLQADADRACNNIIEVFNDMCDNFPPLIRDLAKGVTGFSSVYSERKKQVDVA